MLVLKFLLAFMIATNYGGNRFIIEQDDIWKVSHPITDFTFSTHVNFITSYVVCVITFFRSTWMTIKTNGVATDLFCTGVIGHPGCMFLTRVLKPLFRTK